jgi:hypothetical protein
LNTSHATAHRMTSRIPSETSPLIGCLRSEMGAPATFEPTVRRVALP